MSDDPLNLPDSAAIQLLTEVVRSPTRVFKFPPEEEGEFDSIIMQWRDDGETHYELSLDQDDVILDKVEARVYRTAARMRWQRVTENEDGVTGTPGATIAYIEQLEAERKTLALSWGKHQDLCVCDMCLRACEIITRVNHEGKYK